jgi:hypothetical protein
LLIPTHFGCDAHWKKKCKCDSRHNWTKRHNKVHRDMQFEGIQQHLWLSQHPNNQHKILRSHAPYVLAIDELNTLWARIGSLKLSTNYGASLAKHVANKKKVPWNHMIIICWCNKYWFCACKGLWQWGHEWPLMILNHVFSTKFVWRFGTL